ncbi:MAG: hypothetical protein KDC90_03375 [Ignavibacteriae bacterium]|nr:hypothetical protein [Ignavibacteriota bacterium]
MKTKSKNTEAKKPVSRKAERVTATQSKFLADVRQYGTEQALHDHQRSQEWLSKCLAENSAFKTAYYDAVQLTEKQVRFLQVFDKKMANVKQTCKAIGISRSTYYNWLDKLDTFKKEAENIKEGLFDDVESIIYHKIFVDKDTTSLIFFMKTRMRHRDYVERQEHNVNANVKSQAEITNRYAGMSLEELDEIEKDLRKKAGLL